MRPVCAGRRPPPDTLADMRCAQADTKQAVEADSLGIVEDVERSAPTVACASPARATATATRRSSSTSRRSRRRATRSSSEDGAKVFLDEAAAAVLADKTLDVHAHGDHFHFSLEEQPERPLADRPGLAAVQQRGEIAGAAFSVASPICSAISSS